MSTYNDASLVFYPSGYKASKAYSLKPTDGSGDLDFTRASTATRVNEQGLIENAFVLGSELVVNGNFATDSDWVKASGWTISGGSANTDGTFAYAIYQNAVTTIGKKYKYSFEILNSAGGVIDGRFRNRNGGSILNFSSEGTYSGTFIADGLEVNFITLSLNTTSWSIDNVSVKEVIENNVPRIDYTLGCGKLLLEGQRTNSLLQSNTFNTAWINQLGGGTITGGQINALSESDDAWKLTKDAASGRSIRQAISLSSSTYAYSAFLKSGTLTNASMRVDTSSGARFMNLDLSIGTISSTSGTIVSTSIEDYGNGWYRCTMVVSESITNVHVYVGEFSGTTAGNIYCQRTQLEQGSYSTSYIPTSGTAVTRVADTPSKTAATALIGQTQGTIFFDSFFDDLDTVNFSVSDGTSSNYILIDTSGGAVVFARVQQGGVTQAQINTAPAFYTAGTRLKCAIAYNSNDIAFYINGTLVGIDTSATIPACNQIRFARWNGVVAAAQRVQAAMLFPTRLSNAELATLTTI